MSYDCFFSYQHEDIALVEAIAAKLEDKGLVCWYAPRNVKGRYAKAIAEGISNSKVFVLILNNRSAISEAVLNEVELAHNVSKTSPNAVIQPVCTEKMDMNSPEYGEMMYYIRRIHFINAEDNLDPERIARNIIKNHAALIEGVNQRHKSGYIVQDVEDQRLKVQNEILKKFDDDVYQRVLDEKSQPRVLDVGCGRGDMLIGKIGERRISAYLGVDRSAKQIAAAKEKHNGEGYHFIECDIESEELDDALRSAMADAGVEAFDVINISMVLLHLNDPTRLLMRLHGLLADDGTLIIREIDDGINFAFPDPTNAFERIYNMCNRDEQSGNRRNGRRVHSDLHNAGYKSITLEKQGLSTVGMTTEEKDALFNMYFPFTLYNAGTMSEKYPWNNEYKADYLWYNQNFNNIHEGFLRPDFVFSLGFMTYTAKK